MSFWREGRAGVKMRREQDVPAALPVFSVNTPEEAERIMVHFGKRSYDGTGYYWSGFSGDFRDLPAVTDRIQGYYDSILKG